MPVNAGSSTESGLSDGRRAGDWTPLWLPLVHAGLFSIRMATNHARSRSQRMPVMRDARAACKLVAGATMINCLVMAVHSLRRLACLAVALLVLPLAYAQPRDSRLRLPVAEAPPTHLEPAEPGRFAAAESILGIDGYDCDTTLMLLPAFGPDLGVCVGSEERPDGAQQYYVATVRTRTNLSEALGTAEQPGSAKLRRSISAELADVIGRAVGRAVLRARYPAEGYRAVDGEDGYFSAFVWPLGTIYGMYHSQPAGVSVKLRELALELEKFSRSPNPSTAADEEPLVRRAAKLEQIAARY